jgi:hypothetical protein
LHWLRVLCGLLFLFWLAPFAGHQLELFSLTGWFDARAYREMLQPGGAAVPTGWSLVYLCGENAFLLSALWLAALGVFLLFTLGVATRVTAVLTWLCVVSFTAAPATLYHADFLLIVLAFYLMIGYVLLGQWSGQPAPLERLLGRRDTFLSPWKEGRNVQPSYAANLAVRLLQVHFAIIFMASGLAKLQSGEWWRGAALWFPLHEPFNMTAERLASEAQYKDALLFFLSLAEYLMLAWLVCFPFFAWRSRWRWLVVTGGVLGWIGCIFIYGEPLYGPVYLIGCLSFLSADEWQALTLRTAGLVRGMTRGAQPQRDKKVSVS